MNINLEYKDTFWSTFCSTVEKGMLWLGNVTGWQAQYVILKIPRTAATADDADRSKLNRNYKYVGFLFVY